MPEQNRQERRRAKYGGVRTTEQGGWPTTQPNPVFDTDAAVPADDASSDEPSDPVTASPVEKAEPPAKPEPGPADPSTAG